MRYWEYFNSFGKIENTQSVNTFTKVTGFLGKCFVWKRFKKKSSIHSHVTIPFPTMWPWPIHEDHDIDKLQYTAWKNVHSFWEDFLKNIKKINQFNLFPLEIGHGVMDFQFNQLETHIFIIILFCGCSSDWGEKVDNILRSDR